MGESALAQPVTVAVVDDHQVVLDGIRSWIERDPLRRIVVVADGLWVDAVLAGPGALADVLVLDLGIFGESVVDRIAELAANRRVVAFSADITDDTIRAVLDAGASAYLSKHEGSEHFIAAVVAAARDRPYVTPSVAKAMLGDASPISSAAVGTGTASAAVVFPTAEETQRRARDGHLDRDGRPVHQPGPDQVRGGRADRCRTRPPWWLGPSKTG